MPNGKVYYFENIERKLTLALCGATHKGKEVIESAMEDVRRLRELLTSEERALRRRDE